MLAIAPRTAYELAAEMRHCFEYFWPRAEARVYAEAKQLAVDGLERRAELLRDRGREVVRERPQVGHRPVEVGALLAEEPVTLADLA